jgi:hypothetical protein
MQQQQKRNKQKRAARTYGKTTRFLALHDLRRRRSLSAAGHGRKPDRGDWHHYRKSLLVAVRLLLRRRTIEVRKEQTGSSRPKAERTRQAHPFQPPSRNSAEDRFVPLKFKARMPLAQVSISFFSGNDRLPRLDPAPQIRNNLRNRRGESSYRVFSLPRSPRGNERTIREATR